MQIGQHITVENDETILMGVIVAGQNEDGQKTTRQGAEIDPDGRVWIAEDDSSETLRINMWMASAFYVKTRIVA